MTAGSTSDPATAPSLAQLLRPRSVAVIGASRRPDHPGQRVVRNLLRAGFTGSIHPVNPHCDNLLGLPCYATIDEVAPVDLAVVALPAAQVLDAVRECARSGVRGVVLLAEPGPDGHRLQEEVLAVTREAGMRLVGPDCLGVANTDPDVRLDATCSTMTVMRGRVAMMAQSGAVGVAALQRAEELGIGLSVFVSPGAKADVSGNDLLAYAAEDGATDVVALYLESFGDADRFAALAREVTPHKPVVALVAGGGRMARGEVDALLRGCGVMGVHGLEQLLQTTSVLANQPLTGGRRVGIVSNAGGPALLAADGCERYGLQPVPLSEQTAARIREIVPAAVLAGGYVDLGSGVGPQAYADVLATVANSGEADMLAALHTPHSALQDAAFTRTLATATRVTAPVTTVAVMLDQRAPTRPVGGGRHRVPVFAYPEDAARALAPIARYGEWRAETGA